MTFAHETAAPGPLYARGALGLPPALPPRCRAFRARLEKRPPVVFHLLDTSALGLLAAQATLLEGGISSVRRCPDEQQHGHGQNTNARAEEVRRQGSPNGLHSVLLG